MNTRELGSRIQQAERAIQERLQTIASSTAGEPEYQAIRDALQNLRVLQQELNSNATTTSPGHLHPEVSGEYVVFADTNRKYIDVTEGVCTLLGYSRAELLNKTIDDITAPELRGSVSATFQKYVNAGGMSGNFCYWLATDEESLSGMSLKYSQTAAWSPAGSPYNPRHNSGGPGQTIQQSCTYGD